MEYADYKIALTIFREYERWLDKTKKKDWLEYEDWLHLKIKEKSC